MNYDVNTQHNAEMFNNEERIKELEDIITKMCDGWKQGEPRWSGWPGAWCMWCGCADPNEIELAGVEVHSNHPGKLPCPGPSYNKLVAINSDLSAKIRELERKVADFEENYVHRDEVEVYKSIKVDWKRARELYNKLKIKEE